jgi:hypothetical protein
MRESLGLRQGYDILHRTNRSLSLTGKTMVRILEKMSGVS